MQRRLPKRGFKNYPFSKEYATVNFNDLARIEGVEVITPEIVFQNGILKDMKDGLKVLSGGELTRPLTIRANAFSAAALSKITGAGGKAEVI